MPQKPSELQVNVEKVGSDFWGFQFTKDGNHVCMHTIAATGNELLISGCLHINTDELKLMMPVLMQLAEGAEK